MGGVQALQAARRVSVAAWAKRFTALRIGISFVIPLSICAALGHVTYGALATIGAFAAVYAHDQPYRRRFRVMLVVSLGLILAVTLGTLAAVSPWTIAIGAGLVAGTAAIVGLAWESGPPREFMIVLAFLAVTNYPGDAGDVPLRAALVLGGASVVIAIAMAGWFVRPRGPEEQALQRAFLALARLTEALGTDTVRQARHDALLALEQARSVLAHAPRAQPGDRLIEIALAGEAVMDTTLGLVWHDHEPLDPRWSAAIRTIAASIRDPGQARGLALPDEAPSSPDGLRFASAMDRARRAADPERAMAATLVPFGQRRNRRWGGALRRALRPGSLVVPTAARIGIGVGVGTGIGMLTGVDHGVWVGLTVSAVLQASNVSLIGRRTVDRAVGTILGVGLAAAILTGEPQIVTIIVALGACQVLAQATNTVSYGLSVVFTTPIALMIVEVGRPGTPAGTLLQERVLDTLIGCAIGFAARRFLWPRTAATQLPKAQGAAIEAVHDVLIAALTRADAPSSSLVRRTRRGLHTAMLNLRAVQNDAIGDLMLSTVSADARWPITTAVQRLALAAMAVAAPRDGPPPDREQVARLDEALAAMAAIVEGHRAPMRVVVPAIPGHLGVHHALTALRDVLAAPRR